MDQRSKANPDFLTVKEVADLVRVHRTTVYRWLKAKTLVGSFRVGDGWRIHRAKFEEWVRKSEAEIQKKGGRSPLSR